MNFNKDYWQHRWETNEIGWDIGEVSTPIKEYIDQLQDNNISILIPGCGNAYEAEYLISQGFENTHVIDISPKAIELIKARLPQKYSNNIIQGDFFNHQGHDRYHFIPNAEPLHLVKNGHLLICNHGGHHQKSYTFIHVYRHSSSTIQ